MVYLNCYEQRQLPAAGRLYRQLLLFTAFFRFARISSS